MRRASLRHMNWKILKLLLIPVAVFLTAATRSLAQEAEVSAVEVTGSVPTGLRQDMPVGPYNQPEWTTERGFGTSRVYVRPPGTIEFNQFWTPEFKDGEEEHSFREEVEIGLPYPLQLDLIKTGASKKGTQFTEGGASSCAMRWPTGEKSHSTRPYTANGILMTRPLTRGS